MGCGHGALPAVRRGPERHSQPAVHVSDHLLPGERDGSHGHEGRLRRVRTALVSGHESFAFVLICLPSLTLPRPSRNLGKRFGLVVEYESRGLDASLLLMVCCIVRMYFMFVSCLLSVALCVYFVSSRRASIDSIARAG